MVQPIDMIVPMLRELREENVALHERTQRLIAELDKRLGSVEGAQTSYRQALSADTLMSRLLTGEFDERLNALERKVQAMEGRA